MENADISVMESDRTPAINVEKKVAASVDVLEQALKEAEEYETNSYANPHIVNLQDHGIHLSDHSYINISNSPNSSSVNFNMDSRDNDQDNYTTDGISEKFDVQTSNSNSNDFTAKVTQRHSVNTSSITNNPCIIPLRTVNSDMDTFSDDTTIINSSELIVPRSGGHVTDRTMNIPENQFVLQLGNNSLLPTVTTDISQTFQTYSSSSQYVLKLFGNDASESISSNYLLAEMTNSANPSYLFKTKGLVSSSVQGSNRNIETINNSSSMETTVSENPQYICKLKDNVLPLTIHVPTCNISSDNVSNSLSNVERTESANPQYLFKLRNNPINDVVSSTASTVINTVSENTNFTFQLKDTPPKINLSTGNTPSINTSSRPLNLEKTISAIPQYILKLSGNNSILVPTVDASSSSSPVEKKFNSQYALTFTDNILSTKLDVSTENLAILNPSPNPSTVKNTPENSQYVVTMKDSLMETPTVGVTTGKVSASSASSKPLPSTTTSSNSRMYKLSEDVLSLISEASTSNLFTVNIPSSHTTVDKAASTVNLSNSNVSLFNISSNPSQLPEHILQGHSVSSN